MASLAPLATPMPHSKWTYGLSPSSVILDILNSNGMISAFCSTNTLYKTGREFF